MDWLLIDGVKPPTPSTFQPVYSVFDSDNSKRNEVGVLHRTVIRKGQCAPKYKWNAITTEELNKLLEMCEPDTLTVKYYDPKLLDYKEISCYAQATLQPELIIPRENPAHSLWRIEISFIEY